VHAGCHVDAPAVAAAPAAGDDGAAAAAEPPAGKSPVATMLKAAGDAAAKLDGALLTARAACAGLDEGVRAIWADFAGAMGGGAPTAGVPPELMEFLQVGVP